MIQSCGKAFGLCVCVEGGGVRWLFVVVRGLGILSTYGILVARSLFQNGGL